MEKSPNLEKSRDVTIDPMQLFWELTGQVLLPNAKCTRKAVTHHHIPFGILDNIVIRTDIQTPGGCFLNTLRLSF